MHKSHIDFKDPKQAAELLPRLQADEHKISVFRASDKREVQDMVESYAEAWEAMKAFYESLAAKPYVSGCMTTVASTPPGAQVLVDGKPGPLTPTKQFMLVDRGNGERLDEVVLEGYKTAARRFPVDGKPIRWEVHLIPEDRPALLQ